MSGHFGDLSPKQEQDLAEFRKSLADVLKPKHDDRLLLQFLRARCFDLKKSEEMFRRHLEWRKQNDEDYLLTEYEPPELLCKYMMPAFFGFDKGGSPVRLINAGTTDVRGILSCFKRPEVKTFVTWFLDLDKRRMKERAEQTGKEVETRTFIFDMKDLNIRLVTNKDVVELVVSFLRLYEGNYPENLKVAYVINTPPFFAWMFNLIKSLLSEDTVKKVKIYGHSGWKDDLVDAIDETILPITYGGTRTDPDGDPACPSLFCEKGTVPVEYYLKNQRRLSVNDEGVQQVLISRRSVHSVPLRVDVSGSVIDWEVDCKNCDIHLSFVYTEDEYNDILVKPTRITNDLGLEKGHYFAQKPGTYTLVFDNSYSFIRSKVILYRASINIPNCNSTQRQPD